jgi:hypothetical protein
MIQVNNANISRVLLVISVVLFAIVALSGFGAFTLHHLVGWEFAGFTAFAAAHVV